MAIIAIPRILREKLTDNGAEALVEVINKADEKSKENVIEFVCERFERRLAEETGILRNEISKSKADIIKWMFIFTFGQFWAILSVLFIFFKK